MGSDKVYRGSLYKWVVIQFIEVVYIMRYRGR